MRLKKRLSSAEVQLVLGDVDAVTRMCADLTGSRTPAAPRPEYLRCLSSLASSPFVMDHLEGAAFFVATFHMLFPGFGLRQELESEAVWAFVASHWSYEPFAPDGYPIGVELEDGCECVFAGRTPMQAVARMVRLFLENREAILKEARERATPDDDPDDPGGEPMVVAA